MGFFENKSMQGIVVWKFKKGEDSVMLVSLFEIVLPPFVLARLQNMNNITPLTYYTLCV